MIQVTGSPNEFSIITETGASISAKKILFATGVRDIMPELKGFAECWGISVLHCPYCHGYEVAGKRLGILASGDHAFEFCQLIQQWSDKLTLFSDGPCGLTNGQLKALQKLSIPIVEKKIIELTHEGGYLKQIEFVDGSSHALDGIFSHVPFEQHCAIPEALGCQLTDDGYLEVDLFQKTTRPGIFAAGDATTFFRAIPVAIAAGNKAGAMMNMELIKDRFRTNA